MTILPPHTAMDQLDLKKQNELPPIPFCKRELVYHWHYTTREEAKQDIFEYIKVFYNRLLFHGRVRSEDGCGLTRCPRNWGKVAIKLRTSGKQPLRILLRVRRER